MAENEGVGGGEGIGKEGGVAVEVGGAEGCAGKFYADFGGGGGWEDVFLLWAALARALHTLGRKLRR